MPFFIADRDKWVSLDLITELMASMRELASEEEVRAFVALHPSLKCREVGGACYYSFLDTLMLLSRSEESRTVGKKP